MWVRKRIEISPTDLFRGLGGCVLPGDRNQIENQIATDWQASDTVVCLSVRSGFDLLLHSAAWPPGSEIVMSGLTIPDMPRIVAANGLQAVGVDVDLHTLQPDTQGIRENITPQTRAIVIAHLFGGICDITPVLEIARAHNLLVIEDCAQAYVGSDYQGDERADVSMFSFGPIKTNTALAGAVLRVRNPALAAKMRHCQKHWKVQSRWNFAKRIAKYGFVKAISTRPLCGAFYRFMKLFGKNHDGVASSMARGFAGPGFFEKIRRQPSLPLLHLLHHKLATFDKANTDRRRQLGERFLRQMQPDCHVLGSAMTRQTYWVLPLLVDEPQALVQELWDAGFDASNSCSLHAITQDEASTAACLLRHIVFLPLHICMPEREIDRMASIVKRCSPGKPLFLSDRETSDSAAENGQGVVEQPLPANSHPLMT